MYVSMYVHNVCVRIYLLVTCKHKPSLCSKSAIFNMNKNNSRFTYETLDKGRSRKLEGGSSKITRARSEILLGYA